MTHLTRAMKRQMLDPRYPFGIFKQTTERMVSSRRDPFASQRVATTARAKRGAG